MAKKTLLITFVLAAIHGMPEGEMIRLPELYTSAKNFLLTGDLPDAPQHIVKVCSAIRDCAHRGDPPNEPRYKNDIRWAIRYAKDAGVLKHVGTPRSGEWVRVRPN